MATVWTDVLKTTSETIYFVAENGDTYLVGSAENETLITQSAVSWNSVNKS